MTPFVTAGAGFLLAVLWFDLMHDVLAFRQGAAVLASVAGYGAAIALFGLSRSFALSLAALAASGAADTVSMVIRQTLRQLHTPDELRGRMTSVNMIFFMGGPQLGELEAGLVAQGFGAVVSVVSGGLGCLLATAWTAFSTPALRHDRREDHLLAPAPAGVN